MLSAVGQKGKPIAMQPVVSERGSRDWRTGGQIVVTALAAHGIDKVFCVPGESFLAVLDALYDCRDSIDVVTCRHEHGAAVMAEAYGKLTGRPGVCLVTRGPGACNAAIGVHTAFQDSTPMLMLVGQVKRAWRGREAFQEIDFERMFAPVAKFAQEVSDLDCLPGTMARICQLALSGRMGPAVLALPEDVLSGVTDSPDVSPLLVERQPPEPNLMRRLHRLLGKADRPVLLLGGSGWSREARTDILAFAEANRLPTCCGFRRQDIFPNGHASFIGELGFGANPALVKRIAEADLLIAVGSRLSEATSQGYTLLGQDAPQLIRVHPDEVELSRTPRPALAIKADVAAFASAAQQLKAAGGIRWQTWAQEARADYLADQRTGNAGNGLDLTQVMAVLQQALPDNVIVTVDAGNFSGWPQRYLRFGGERRLLGATNGAMGYGVPAAIAAKLIEPRRTVVACVGDGGFGMTGQELATAVRYGAAIVVLVFNNEMYGTIRMHQERTYPGRVVATGLTNPDCAALARAYGCRGDVVERTAEFEPALTRALQSGRPSLIELRVDPDVISTRTTLSAIRRQHPPHSI